MSGGKGRGGWRGEGGEFGGGKGKGGRGRGDEVEEGREAGERKGMGGEETPGRGIEGRWKDGGRRKKQWGATKFVLIF